MARYYRALFLPLGAMIVTIALNFLPTYIGTSATQVDSYQPMLTVVYDVGYSHADFDLLKAEAPALKHAGERVIDAHAASYIRANQPLASWRMAADIGYDRIDPHRRIG